MLIRNILNNISQKQIIGEYFYFILEKLQLYVHIRCPKVDPQNQSLTHAKKI